MIMKSPRNVNQRLWLAFAQLSFKANIRSKIIVITCMEGKQLIFGTYRGNFSEERSLNAFTKILLRFGVVFEFMTGHKIGIFYFQFKFK